MQIKFVETKAGPTMVIRLPRGEREQALEIVNIQQTEVLEFCEVIEAELYVGVAHKAAAHVTVMDESGTILRRRQIVSSSAAVHEALGDLKQPMKAVNGRKLPLGPDV